MGTDIEFMAKPRAYLPQDLATQLDIDHLERHDKESGYASIHYQCKLLGTKLSEPPHFELQVRTLVEDVWGEIEHILGYKRNKKTALPVTREFKILSKQLGAIDEHFALIYDRQLKHRTEIAISEQDPPNAENIPRELADVGLAVSQDEIDGLLRVMASRGITTIGELRIRGSPLRIEAIQSAWETELGRRPSTFDVVAVLGTISADATVEEVGQRTVEWATVAREWSKRLADDTRGTAA